MAVKTDPSSIWSELQRGLNYQTAIGLASQVPEYVRFKEGDQWPPSTALTKHAAKPVINQCDFTVETRKSNILSQTIKMIFEPEELPEGQDNEELQQASQDMTDMAQNTWNDIDEEELNEEWVEDALLTGTGIKHYYFDNSFKGGTITKYIGKLQGETIDVLDIFFANPHLKPKQTQKQPWIMIRSYEDTDLLIEKSKEEGSDWQNIQPDGNNTDKKYDSARTDMQEKRETTCLTKYYRENGQIYWTKVTESAVILTPRPLAPEGSKKEFAIYPLRVLVFKRRRNCIYGISVLKDVIPVQKMINFIYGMIANGIQDVAWPKIISKMGALQQAITNVPGEILIDHTANPGIDGFKFMQPPNFSKFPVEVSDRLIEMQRQVNGTHDVITGEQLGANMAAAAIIALQNQAKKPVENDQKKLFRAISDTGKIYEEFYKCYYNMPRPMSGKDQEGNETTKNFDGSKYADMGFGLKIDVGPASVFSESLQMTVLDSYADRGWIDKYQHAKYSPSNVIPQELRQDFKKESEQLAEQQQMMPQAEEILSQLTPEERAAVEADPSLLDGLMGGGANEMPPMQP
jgi:hypothetical protein